MAKSDKAKKPKKPKKDKPAGGDVRLVVDELGALIDSANQTLASGPMNVPLQTPPARKPPRVRCMPCGPSRLCDLVAEQRKRSILALALRLRPSIAHHSVCVLPIRIKVLF